MAYATVDQIRSMFRQIKISAATGDDSTETVVTTEDVDEFIEEVESELNAKLSLYYITPITGTESLKIMRRIVRMKVSHIIKGVLEVQDAEKTQDVQADLDKKANKMIETLLPQENPVTRITDPPKMPLPDADVKETSPRNGSLFKTSVSGTTVEPTITKGGNNW